MLTNTNSAAVIFPNAFWELASPEGRHGASEGHWLVLCYIPDLSDPARVGIDLLTMRVSASTGHPQRLKELHTALQAILPQIQDYRAALLDLKALVKSPADGKALSHQSFRCNWLEWRCKEAFEAVRGVGLKEMGKTALAFKPLGRKTYFEALSANGYALKLFEEDDLTPEICAKAIESTPGALRLVPGRFRTRELCLNAVAGYAPGAQVLQYVPVSMRDEELITAALRADGLNLQHVPDELKNVELCALACVQNGLAWDHVPAHLRMPEVEFAVAMHGIHSRDPGAVHQSISRTAGFAEADRICTRWEREFQALHYPKATEEELEDLGLPIHGAAAPAN